MLKTVRFTDNCIGGQGCVLLLGGFDGLHVGHKKLVARAKEYGLPVGIMSIIGGKDGESLFTAQERERVFENAGVDFAFFLPFEKIRDMSAEDFAALLITEYAPKAFICGDDFRFGKGAAGTPALLKQATHVPVEVQPLVEMDGEKVSARAIKKWLAIGETTRANERLGGEFFLIGRVEKDRQVGRTIGFPTANIRYPEKKFPLKTGVYESYALVDGKKYKGITNYGARPTFDNAQVWTETHLDGFDGDLYGKELTLYFCRYLRDIRKFENGAALRAQLNEDIRRVREND
ncbi:MAG: riboflavin biosynthesis protein RibF [Clostridia bacterium]|nr:riboflavin biosynthesis protein RibF [Clostridia bacterium]